MKRLLGSTNSIDVKLKPTWQSENTPRNSKTSDDGTTQPKPRGKMKISRMASTRMEDGSSDIESDSRDYTGFYGYSDSNKIPALDAFGVRVVPGVVAFRDVFESQTYSESVSVQNISEKSVNVKLSSPQALAFRLTSHGGGHFLAPGLKIKKKIQYTSTKPGICHSSLPIHVNDECFEVPLEVSQNLAFVEVTPTYISFGRVDLGSKLEEKIVIRNESSCATKFLVDLGRNKLNIEIKPQKGWIRPHSFVTLQLQLAALKVGEQSSEIWVFTDLSQTRIQVDMEVCKHGLFTSHPNSTSEFTLLTFPTTFYGCREYQTISIYNMAASPSAFIVLADVGSHQLKPFRQAKKEKGNHVEMFDIEPVEGKISPFEGRIFKVSFQPKSPGKPKLSWKSKSTVENQDYLCKVKIMRISVEDYGADRVKKNEEEEPINDQVTPKTAQPNTATTMYSIFVDQTVYDSPVEDLTSLDTDSSVVLCLYGEVESPNLTVSPMSLNLATLEVGDRIVKLIHVTNKSSNRLAFRYIKIPFFHISPVFGEISPNDTFQLEVKYSAQKLGEFHNKLTFEVLSLTNDTDGSKLQLVSHLSVKVHGKVTANKDCHKIHLEPKFNAGITPLVTHEVGYLTDDVTFSSKINKPRAAMAYVNKKGRPWIDSDATIAFPNDRPLTLRPRNTDATAKTIFKGLDRYRAPVDESMTYTVESLLKKQIHNAKFLKFIRGSAALSVICKAPVKQCCKQQHMDTTEPAPLSLLKQEMAKSPHDIFEPLTIIQLYFIKIYPTLLSFGSVTTRKICTQLITIDNQNSFKIGIKILPLSSCIRTSKLDNYTVKENSKTEVVLSFYRETLGRFSSTITCVINGHHFIDIPVVAEVLPKSLNLDPDVIELKLTNTPFALTFIPLSIQNPLNTPVCFSWLVPDASAFKIEPISGVVPKIGSIWCCAYFQPDCPNYMLHPLKLKVEGVEINKVKCGVALVKPNIGFLERLLNVGYIPLKLTTQKRCALYNLDFFDAMFVVLNKHPIDGVLVEPLSGTIKARSCFGLKMCFTMTNEGPIDFVLYVNIQNMLTIELKVEGVVVRPEVEIRPKRINLTRVTCNSVTKTTLVAENKSTARAELSIDMEDFPQFKVTLSKKQHMLGSSCGFSLDPGAFQRFYLYFIPKDLSAYDFILPVVVNDCDKGKDQTVEQYYSEAQSGRKLPPTSTKSGKPLVPKQKNLQMVLINVKVIKSILEFSDLEMTFTFTFETKVFTTKNVSDECVHVMFRCEHAQPAFSFEVNKCLVTKEGTKVSIPPGCEVPLNVVFTASSQGTYQADIDILLVETDHSNIYNNLHVSGSIIPICEIRPSVNNIYLPPVPLDVEISHILSLTVNNQNNNREVKLRYEANNYDEELFQVIFLKGNSVPGFTSLNVPVKITFRSPHPTSVRKLIKFCCCGEGLFYSVTVIATADNCLMTNHAYVSAHTLTQSKLKEVEDIKSESNALMGSDRNLQQINRQMAASKSKTTIDKIGSFSIHSTVSSPTLQSGQAPKLPTLSISDKSTSDYDILSEHNNLDENDSKQCDSPEYSSVSKEEEHCSYPKFPMCPAVTEHAIHMYKTLNAVQQWVYEEVFCCSFFPIFGSHLFSSFNPATKGHGQHCNLATKNVFDALEKICGRKIQHYFQSLNKCPDESTARAIFRYNVYKQLLEFMVTQGALLAHVEPEYLLSYDDYCTHVKTDPTIHKTASNYKENYDTDEVKTELLDLETFQSISIQCWLDLFLQIYRTLVLPPAVGMNVGELNQGALRQSLKPEVSCGTPTKERSSQTCLAEEVLLTWLSNHYNEQRTKWNAQETPTPRNVTNFHHDLEDGLVLAAVTIAFCPFLVPIHFSQMFLQPVTISQAYHNVVCLTRAWVQIRLGFSVTPKDFIEPNPVKMLMLVTHLYKILPTYIAETKIKFTATLNTSEMHVITLDIGENSPASSITYHIEIIPDNLNFTLDNCKDVIVLRHKQKVEIPLRFTARCTTSVNAILLLCGACQPPKFGRNYVFDLEGSPTKLPVSSIFNLISPLNTPVTTPIYITCPHKQDTKSSSPTLYDIWITSKEPQPGNLKTLNWEVEKKRKLPQRLFILSQRLVVETVDKRLRVGKLELKICCFTKTSSNYWLVFTNKNFGDFIVKLHISPAPPEPSSTLTVYMDSRKNRISGVDKTSLCNIVCSVNIPCCNSDQMSAVRTMFELTIPPAEKEFWATYIDSNIGLRLLQWMLEEKNETLSEEIMQIFEKSKSYKVSCKSPHVTCPVILDIPNVKAKSFVPIELLLDLNTQSHTTLLTLTSTDGLEIRCYTLKVVCKE